MKTLLAVGAIVGILAPAAQAVVGPMKPQEREAQAYVARYMHLPKYRVYCDRMGQTNHFECLVGVEQGNLVVEVWRNSRTGRFAMVLH